MKNLIIIIGDKKYQFDTKEELLQKLLGDLNGEYSSMTEEEKKKRRYLKAYINLMGENEKILDLKEAIKQQENLETDGKFLIDNDDVYVMSLLRMNQIILLERIDANIFARNIEKNGIEDNYIILNSYATEIIDNYRKEII